MPHYFLFADIAGIGAFALSGFLVAIKNRLDILGILIASALTALGGGVLRDVILDKTPFAFTTFYPAVTLGLTIFAVYILKLYRQSTLERQWLFVISDTIGLVAFSITGALLALEAHYNFFGVLIVSFVTAVGGGVIRDVMINQVPAVLISDFYGSIAVLVALFLSVASLFGVLNEGFISFVAIFSILLRIVAYKQQWHLPKLS